MTFAVSLRAAPAAAPHPFASVAAFDDFAGVGDAWAELEAERAGGYQRLAFARACGDTIHVRARLALALARDDAGRPVALLPLVVSRGPVRVARFIGAKWANYHMGLFRPGLDWRPESVRLLLQETARTAGIDLFAFTNQPPSWEGLANPLALLPGRPSPDAAFATTLAAPHSAWLDAHFSRASQKKMRKKARKLDALGGAAHRRAASAEEASRYLEAFFRHKAEADPPLRSAPAVRRLLRRLAAEGAMELHALVAGERIAATFGALPGGRRLSGLVISYDPAAAAASPGEQLLIEVARDARERGFETLDLGVGASRYKREVCEIEERLFDSAFPASLVGRLAAPAFYASRAALGAIKRQPRWLALAARARRAFEGG